MISEINTHLKIEQRLCGTPEYTENGNAKVSMKLTEEMAADETGLVHGGFIFGLADYAAMIAVNHQNVVLASASCKFLKPSKTDETLTAKAEVISTEKNKYNIKVGVYLYASDIKVFEGDFFAVVPKKHVLS